MSMNSPYKVIVKEPSAALKKKGIKPGRKHFIVIGPDGEESLRWWSNNSEEADSDCKRLNAAYAKGLTAAQAANVDLLAAAKAVEWEGDGEDSGEHVCPSCYAGKSEGHYAGCILAAAITKAEAAK